jgi:hypothetical protein
MNAGLKPCATYGRDPLISLIQYVGQGFSPAASRKMPDGLAQQI